MKLFTLIALLCLPSLSKAQTIALDKSVISLLKEVQMGMSLADFKKLKPNAVEASSSDYRFVFEEKTKYKAIPLLTYYLDKDGNQPYYEVIIDFDTEATLEKVSKKLFGEQNHPTDKKYWVVYKGTEGFLTVAWTYNSSLIISGRIPTGEYYNDEMYNLTEGFADVDMRLNKSDVFKPVNTIVKPKKKVEKPNKIEETPSGTYTCEDYAKELTVVFETGIKIKLPADSIEYYLADAKKQASSFDFKDIYRLDINKNGAKGVSLVCDKDGNKPLYEIIFEFDNADSTRQLAEMMFGTPSHPVLDNHWVLGIGENNAVSLAWTYENKLIIATNLPDSEFADDDDFKLSEEFIKKFNGEEDKPVDKPVENTDDKTTDNEATSLTVNNLIAAAAKDFEDFKTEPIANKKEEFNAEKYVTMGQDQAVIRKSAAGNWRLEIRFPTYATSEDVKTAFENTLTFYQTLEGLEYRLVKKSDLSTANGRTYIWDIQTLDDASTGIILKWQSYPTSNGQFGIKMELGK